MRTCEPFTLFEKRPKACRAVYLDCGDVLDETSRQLTGWGYETSVHRGFGTEPTLTVVRGDWNLTAYIGDVLVEGIGDHLIVMSHSDFRRVWREQP